MFVIVVNFTKAIENQCFIFHVFLHPDSAYPLNPIADGHFRGCSWMVEGGQKGPLLPKICHTYPIMMKLDSYTLPKEDPKNT